MRKLKRSRGGLAQLVEHLLCKQGVNGSSPLSSTREKKEVIDMLGTREKRDSVFRIAKIAMLRILS